MLAVAPEWSDISTLADEMAGKTGGTWEGGGISDRALEFLLARGRSFGAEMQTYKTGLGHVVVVDGVDSAGRLMIRDPWGVNHGWSPGGLGSEYTMTKDEFMNGWLGRVIFDR